MRKENLLSVAKLYFAVAFAATFLSVIFTLGCSPQWHVKRAIKKDPSIQYDHIDTVYFRTHSVEKDTSFTDSIEVDNVNLNIKVNRIGDQMYLRWKLKEFQYDTIFNSKIINVYDTIIVKKTRFETRLDAKQKRIETKYIYRLQKDSIKTDQKVKLSEQKTSRTEKRKNNSPLSRFWNFLNIILATVIAFVIGVCIGRFTKKFGIF